MASSPPLDELRDLFTGVPAEAGGWATTPAYNVGLALEIAVRTDSRSEYGLREVLYDSSSPDDIPPAALAAIQLAVARYRTMRQLEKGEA